jgi:hypothetical protein
MSGRMSVLLFGSDGPQVQARRWLTAVAAVAFVVAFAVTLVSAPRDAAPRAVERAVRPPEPAGRVAGQPARLRSVARLPTAVRVPPTPAPAAPAAATLVVAPQPEATAVPTAPPPVAPAPAHPAPTTTTTPPPTTTTEPGPSFDSSDMFDSSG